MDTPAESTLAEKSRPVISDQVYSQDISCQDSKLGHIGCLTAKVAKILSGVIISFKYGAFCLLFH